MLPSISKSRLYLYLFFFITLTSIFNFQLLEVYQNKFILKQINISGLSNNEKKIVENEFKNLKNISIFKLDKDKIFNILNKFKFLEEIHVNKVIPSTININLSKTSILGKTLINDENFYIGRNGKLIESNQLFEKIDTSTIYGNFKVQEFLNLIDILDNNQLDRNKIKEFYYYKNKRWDLLFSNGVTLMLPSKNFNESIKIYKNLLKNSNLINIKIIDLRVSNQIILTNYNE